MFFIRKFKEWWDIIDFKNNVLNLIKETPDVKKNAFSLFLVILILNFVSGLWTSFSGKFMIGRLIFSTLKDTLYYFIEILIIGLLIYFVLKYLFRKEVPMKNFLSPYLKIDTALWGILAWLFSALTIVVALVIGVILLIFIIIQNPEIMGYIIMMLLPLITFLSVIVFLVLLWVIIAVVLQVRLIKNVFRINGFLSFLILIIAGVIIGLIFSPISKIESPDLINKIAIDYNAEKLFDNLGIGKPNYDREEIRDIALNAVKEKNNNGLGVYPSDSPVFKKERLYVYMYYNNGNETVGEYNVIIDDNTGEVISIE